MAKKFVITGITCKNTATYAVGQALQSGDVVTSITFNRADCPFNKGYQVPGASYTIKITNEIGSVDNMRILIPFGVVNNVVGDWVENKKSENPEEVGLVE